MTGGSGGIGGALAEELTTHGARVVVADLDAARAQAVADKINALTGFRGRSRRGRVRHGGHSRA